MKITIEIDTGDAGRIEEMLRQLGEDAGTPGYKALIGEVRERFVEAVDAGEVSA